MELRRLDVGRVEATVLTRSRESWRLGLAAVIGLAVATVVVHRAGGTHTVFPHLYYLPIGIAAVLGGPFTGVAVGVAAGLLAGPLTPMDTAAGTAQETSSWLIRLAFFAAAGGVTGSFAARLSHRASELARLNEDTVRAFVRAIDSRDPYTAKHSEKVAAYAVELADALSVGAPMRDRVRWAGLLHDLGKIALPETVLNKPGRLEPGEWALVKHHPLDSAEIVGGVAGYRAYLPGIRHHHERYDGGGYPDGLRGEQIPFEARILAVADAFDAMTSNRTYRATTMNEEEALRQILAGAGSQFDPAMATAFVEYRRGARSASQALEEHMPPASTAPLATGEATARERGSPTRTTLPVENVLEGLSSARTATGGAL